MNSPLLILLVLTALVAALWKLEKHPLGARIFSLLPLPFWCYMIPTIATAAGWLPPQNPLYSFFSSQLLPVCLLLLLIPADLKGIARLGTLSLLLMGIGAVGTIAGGLISFYLHKAALPPGSWAAIGALSATWIGGSINLLAVKEALGVSDSLIGPVIVMDALLTYSWMALLIWGSAWQTKWDRRVLKAAGPDASPSASAWSGCKEHPTTSSGHFVAARRSRLERASPPTTGPVALIGMIILSILISLGAQSSANYLPAIGQIITASTWTVLLVTSAGILISLMPIGSLKEPALSKTGTFLLYLLLASIGARADLKAIFETPVFLSLGLVWIGIHGVFLLVSGYLLRAPLGLIATASQASIGGVISGPIVGATYHPKLATVGLLMAILGNCVGTYLGVLTASLAKLIAG